jgi:hypothetical protein
VDARHFVVVGDERSGLCQLMALNPHAMPFSSFTTIHSPIPSLNVCPKLSHNFLHRHDGSPSCASISPRLPSAGQLDSRNSFHSRHCRPLAISHPSGQCGANTSNSCTFPDNLQHAGMQVDTYSQGLWLMRLQGTLLGSRWISIACSARVYH